MALTIVGAAAVEPVTIDEQKLHLRLDTDDDDAYVALCIKAARQWIEGQTKRAIINQIWDYSIDYEWPFRFGGQRIDFPLNPVQAQGSPETVSITYIDSDGASQTLASSQYIVVSRSHGSFIVPAYDVTWPAVRWVPNAITVRFLAGDTDRIPQPLHQAIMILAGHYYENRETAVAVPTAVESLISSFR
jgi:uncharacterized phiE125 gp8 family phage protein